MEDADIRHLMIQSKIALPDEWSEIWKKCPQSYFLITGEESENKKRIGPKIENLFFHKSMLKQ